MKGRSVLFFILFNTISSFSFEVFAQLKSVNIANSNLFYCTQKQTNWCWAACNQMLLKSVGIIETQESQVTKLFGYLVNQGAGPNYEQAKLALAGTYLTNNGTSITVRPHVSYLQPRNPNDPIIIIEHLREGIPIVMATQAHGRVCVGVDYVQNGQSFQIISLRLLDPARPIGIITYTMQQFLAEGLIGFMTFDID